MRNLKKILALVLALVMSLSLMATASAASFPDVADDNAYKTAIDVLNGVKVFQGYNDGAEFRPTGEITRAEVAAIIYRISTGDVTDSQKDIYTAWNGAGKLSDVTTGWYAGYVNFCSNAGYIKGYPDGTFKASNKVTGYEVLAMILRAVGYGRNGEFSGSNWAITVGSLAQTLGITKNVKEDLGSPATRQMVAELLFRSIFTETQKYNALYMYEGTGTNLARENLSLEEVEGVVIANEYANLEGTRTLADGKTLIRDEKNAKDYTINWSTNLDDMGESRLIYIQNKTNVINLADSGKNAKAESTEDESVTAILGRAGISAGDAERYLNFDKAFKRDSAYKIKYVLKADASNEINGMSLADVRDRINAAAGEKNRAKISGTTVEVTIVKRTPITNIDMDYMERIFGKADKKTSSYIDGEVYVGTQSNTDISDVDADQKYSWESFCEEFIEEKEDDAAVSKNDNGNWLKVIDNDGDGTADYIFKVIYTVAQVTRVKDDVVTLDTKNHTLSFEDKNGGIYICDTDAINNLTDEEVVSADTLAVDDVVYYAVIEDKAQTYKAAMETASFKDVSRNSKIAVTTDGTEWTQSDVCEHIEDEAFSHDVRNLAGKVSYDCYFDRGGFLAAFVKTDKAGDFRLITDGWFMEQKSRSNEYAVNAYNDAEGKLEVVDITKYGDLFIASARALNNGWDALKYLGGTNGGDFSVDTAVTGILDDNQGAALNGDNVVGTAPSRRQYDKIHTTVAAITADGTLLPVHDSSVTGRYDHEMIALDSIPTMAAVNGTIYDTSNGSDTAYDRNLRSAEVRALDSTIYYVVWGTNANARVLSFVGHDNAPSAKKLAGLIEDIYCVGTRRTADNDTDRDVTYSADVVVIELNGAYPDDREPFFVVDNDWRRTDIGDYRVDGIDSKGEKVEDMRVSGRSVAPYAYVGGGIANTKQFYPGLYWRTEVSEGVYKLDPMTGAEIAAQFSVGTVVEESWTSSSYIVMQSWNTDTVYGIGPKGYNPGKDAQAVLDTSVEKQYKITDAALYTLAYGGDDYDDYAAELEKADLKDVLNSQVDDVYVESSRVNNELNRDTWFLGDNNVHYYNRNKVLVFHGDSNSAVWAVSLANVVDNGDYHKDWDYASVVWEKIVDLIPAAIYSGTEIEVMGQTYDATTDPTNPTWVANSETDKVAVEAGLNVKEVVGNVAYTDKADGIELKLDAPVGTKFYKDSRNEIAIKFSDGDNAHLHDFKLSNSDRTLTVTLKGIDEDITFTVGLVADASNAPKVIVKSKDNVLKITDTLTYNAPLNNISLTFKDKNGNTLAANESVTVNKVFLGDKKLTEGAAEMGYTLTGNTLKLHGTTQVTADITIEAALSIKTSETITLVAAGGNAMAVTGDAPTKFTIRGATVDGNPVKPVGCESEDYPLNPAASFTFEVPVGKTLKVSLASGSYAYSDDINVNTEEDSFYVITVAAGSTDTIVIDKAERFTTASSNAGLTIGETELTKGKTTKDAALSDVEEVAKGDVEAAKGATMTSSTVKNEAGETITVYKVIAENKTIKFYAVKFTETPAEPEAPVVPPVSEVVGNGTAVEGEELSKVNVATGYALPAGVTATEQKVVSAAKHKVTEASVKEGKVEATKQTDAGQAVAVEQNAAFQSVKVEQVKDTAAAPKAGEAKVTWKITITLKENTQIGKGIEFTIAVLAAKDDQGSEEPTTKPVELTTIAEPGETANTVAIPAAGEKNTQKYVLLAKGTDLSEAALNDGMDEAAAKTALGIKDNLTTVQESKVAYTEDDAEKILVVLEFGAEKLVKAYTYTIPAKGNEGGDKPATPETVNLTLKMKEGQTATLTVTQDGKTVEGTEGVYAVDPNKAVTVTINKSADSQETYTGVTCSGHGEDSCTLKFTASNGTWTATIEKPAEAEHTFELTKGEAEAE